MRASIAATTRVRTTRVRYSKRPDKQEELFFYTVSPPEEVGRVTNLEADEIAAELKDLRSSDSVTLHRNGFKLVEFPSGQGVDWEDDQQVGFCSCHYPQNKHQGFDKRIA